MSYGNGTEHKQKRRVENFQVYTGCVDNLVSDVPRTASGVVYPTDTLSQSCVESVHFPGAVVLADQFMDVKILIENDEGCPKGRPFSFINI